jgi:hypothetical protein
VTDVRLLLTTLYCFALAAVIGLGSTYVAISRGDSMGALTIGAWSARPKAGTAEIDPYSRAEVERTGALPLGLGDGVVFSASKDDSGRALDGRCDVTLTGTTPQARLFTITLYDFNGRLVPNSLGRSGFTSQELIRAADGSFRISVGPRARPGNWLPTGGIERYVLMLRLYDTPVGIATRAGRETPMPAVVTGRCL